MKTADTATRFFLCLSNEGYEASLRVRTVYRNLEDSEAASHGLLRVVDETGEDYLFPSNLFVRIQIPKAAAAALADVI